MILRSKDNASLAVCIALAAALAVLTGDGSIVTAAVVVGLALRLAGGIVALALEPVRA